MKPSEICFSFFTLFLLPVLHAEAGEAASLLRPVYLRCEYRLNPRGIDEPHPRLSWILHSCSASARDQKQTAYRILVAGSRRKLTSEAGDLWDTGTVESDRSTQIVYRGMPLSSRQVCWWKVRVRDQHGRWSPWSEPAFWTMGLLSQEEWHGRWIGMRSELPSERSPLSASQWIWFPEKLTAPLAPPGERVFRRTFSLPQGKEVRQAQLFLTADNSFTLFVNAEEWGRGTSFMELYSFNVTEKLAPGRNVVAVKVSNAGDKPNPAGLIGFIEITLSDGQVQKIITDGAWKAAAEAAPSWTEATYEHAAWQPARVLGRYGMKPWGEVAKPERRTLPARYLRREFTLKSRPERASAYACGLGLFELSLNGRPVTDHVLSPALSEYPTRVFYVTFDVTDFLRPGRNAVGVILGNGRYFAPRLRVPTRTRTFGFPKLLLELRIDYSDGTPQRVVSDTRWRVTDQGPIRANNEYDGEVYDARRAMPHWNEPGFDDSAWKPAEGLPPPGGRLCAQPIEPIRVTEILTPQLVSNPEPGKYIFDMGQNLVGWCRLKVRGPRGSRVALRHAERLRNDGTLYVENLRSAKAQDVYILSGGGLETYQPRFTYHGFRYVEVSGFPGEVRLESLRACVVHDDLEPTGSFACSHRLLTRLHRIIRWGIRGNYRSIPTDCPQRDERQGWLGDRSAESRGEAYLFDMAAFYSKRLTDIHDCQKSTGSIPDVAPAYWPLYMTVRNFETPDTRRTFQRANGLVGPMLTLGDGIERLPLYSEHVASRYLGNLPSRPPFGKGGRGPPLRAACSRRSVHESCTAVYNAAYWPLYNDNVTWPSSFIIIPNHLYEHYGDVRIVRRHFEAQKKWITYMSSFLKDGILNKDNYGDWCVPPEEPHLIHSRDPARKTPGDFLATAYFYHDLRLMAKYARILGKENDRAFFEKKARMIRRAFNKRFFNARTGLYANGSQTSCLLPLAFGLVSEEHRERLFQELISKIEKESRLHIGTGLIGAQWLMEVLTRGGRVDVAYAIASQKTYPSWGYMIERGATTVWELWNGDTANPAMNSRNHVMLVGDLLLWLYAHIAGIATDRAAPGFKRILIRPHPTGDLTWAKASHLTPHGTVYCAWRIEGENFHLTTTIPVNTQGRVFVPAESAGAVCESGKPAQASRGVRFLRMEKGYAVFEVGSGMYRFVSHSFSKPR